MHILGPIILLIIVMWIAIYFLTRTPKPRVSLRERVGRIDRNVRGFLRWLFALAVILLGIAAVLVVVAGANWLFSATASARTLVRQGGWQIHIFYTEPVNGRAWITIGPPFETQQLCEDTKFPILIERIHDSVRCVWVGELWTN